MPYNHHEIDKKWQQRWEDERTFVASDTSPKKKFYCLIEFPYPSGSGLHIGHPRSYTALDVLSRKRRMQGYEVLYPIGWDAFGLPTENYAIKTGRKPQNVTTENIATFRRQLKSLGLSFDWSREINTTDPEYYKWTQWMFLEFFRAGLAYKKEIPINWCISCKIGLANEEVVDGVCERCGGGVEKRKKSQWLIAITKYAQRLLDDLEDVDYLEKIKIQQRNWIGRSEGAHIKFPLPHPFADIASVEVFTTRPDTLYGATYIVLAPEHPLVNVIVSQAKRHVVQAYVDRAEKMSEMERTNDQKEKKGVFTGAYAIHPATHELLPIWIAEYVLMEYGTGAIMAVPAHDERDFAFAAFHKLPIVEVVRKPVDHHGCWTGDGAMQNSDFLNGLSTSEAISKINDWLEQSGVGKRCVTYKLHDWIFSRQRYWGEPIPLVWCDACDAWIPVDNDQLPVVLPDIDQYEPTHNGESPLASIKHWVNTTCPACAGPARRETDTMPNWAGSSWYFLGYAMHHTLTATPPFSSELPARNKAALAHWMPVDFYNGGMEHTTLHLLYSRFWNKFLFDRGISPVSEPYARRHSHGLVLAQDGTKMSKSKGNVVNPDEIVEQYGADAFRLYILFMGPFEEPVPWNVNGLRGVRRFLDKVYGYVCAWKDPGVSDTASLVEQAIKKVSDDIDGMKFNTAVAALMKLFNELGEAQVTRAELVKILLVLCAFAPHHANECWEKIGETGLADVAPWPNIDESLLEKSTIEIAIQVNGKLRGSILVPAQSTQEHIVAHARLDHRVAKYVSAGTVQNIIYVQGRVVNFVIV